MRYLDHLVAISRAVANREGNRRAELRPYLARLTYPVLASMSNHLSVEHEKTTYIVPSADKEISRSIFRHGHLDQPMMDRAYHLWSELTGVDQPGWGQVFIDVGANIGVTSIPAITRYGAGKVLAFEPDPHNYRLLRCNLIMNDLEDRVIPVQAALANQPGTVTLELSPDNWGDHRVRTDSAPGLFDEPNRETVTIRAARLDDELAFHSISAEDVGLLWIDTQGFEGHVLAGCSRLLDQRPAIVFELWPYGLKRAGGYEMLDDALRGYALFDIRASLEEGRAIRTSLESAYNSYVSGTAHTDLLALDTTLP